MLTIYEQMQGSIDLVESDLFEDTSPEAAASAAGMSLTSFQRYFPALTGYRFGEYVRRRRLSEALEMLVTTDRSVLEIALRAGYDSHEAFTRAFKREFRNAPFRFRTDGRSAARTSKLNLVGEVIMGVLTKELPEMTVACFDGFRPDPEHEALLRMASWLRDHPRVAESYRSFGYNIDRSGNRSDDPDNEGYRILVTLPPDALPLKSAARVCTIRPGTFVVTSIEGSFTDDPTGSWITEGWRRLRVMVERQGLRVHPSCRWFEESREPSRPDRTRFDLYLEIEQDAGSPA